VKITVVGAGYVGLVTATCLSELGNHVTVLDIDIARVQMLQTGVVPIYEPGLEELVVRNLQASRLRFSHDAKESIEAGEAIFIAVGTPPNEDGSADLNHVLNVAQKIGRHMNDFKVVINKSTVPVGTANQVSAVIQAELRKRGVVADFSVVSNPEFLKEGAAVEDFMRPDRIVIGVQDDPHGQRAKELMTLLYAPFNRHHERTVWMDVRSAELTKYAANAMLATRISFMNEIARLADAVDADIDAVRRGIGADQRIGPGFLYAGVGYGGSCFPKDTRALIRMGQAVDVKMSMVAATEQVNKRQKHILVEHVRELYGLNLDGVTVGLWGLAFKPNTDDLREAPSRTIMTELLKMGARIQAYDPVAMPRTLSVVMSDLESDAHLSSNLTLVESPERALCDADVLIVVTEWKCFRSPDWRELCQLMRTPQILDGRNLYDPKTLAQWGIAYRGVGRRNELSFSGLKEIPVSV
jgi:UDPglucose 6-dehydrogenase